MPSKLTRYMDGIMEAAWLAAMILLPVFFNIFSARIFEPDKITLLRSLALVILAAWLVKLVDSGPSRAGERSQGESRWQALRRTPLLLPAAALALVYLLSTLFSVSPRASLWGSYQRLQGTYTLFSYMVIFAAIIGNVRRRVQVERVFTTVILASLPVSLYGVLQRYQLDPVPWGGNTTIRIAANLGNSIFVAAYLIMVFPLTAIRIVHAFGDILSERGKLLANFLRSTTYVFIATLQLIALYLSGSRGPWLGWAASLGFLGLLLSLIWRKRWLTVAWVSVALLGALFLVVLNIPGGPLESLRSVPGIGRLGQLLDAESRTGRVRTLIWEGAADMVLPHEPLQYPDGGEDRFNFLRPLIGYGPESMYVAYNPFYQPELTQVEKRNATPDRSHNETWDALVITGLLGLSVELFLFGSIFYYGLKWLGVIASPAQRNLFLALFLGGGALSATLVVLQLGRGYFGVGLPLGMIIGLIVYLIVTSLFGHYKSPASPQERLRALTLLGLLAAIAAHFVEIHFGIAIAVTRAYFWAFTGLLVVVGYVLPQRGGEYGAAEGSQAVMAADETSRAETPMAAGGSAVSGNAGKKKRRTARIEPSPAVVRPGWVREAVAGGLILTILLATLGYNYINVFTSGDSVTRIIWASLTSLRDSGPGSSLGLVSLALITWLAGGVLLASESPLSTDRSSWMKTLVVVLGVSFVAGLLFWFLQAGGLSVMARFKAATVDDMLAQIGRYEGMLTRFYVYVGLLVFLLAAWLSDWSAARATKFTQGGMIAAPAALLLVIALASYTNLRVIQADIAFKLAEPFNRPNQWPVAIQIYQRANALAPSEDYYYLFLGRAYLEHSRTLNDSTQRDEFIRRAEADLMKAQSISPLNTDHTANLARLNSLWASATPDPQQKEQRAKASSAYFDQAVTLSPNNARLWSEWGLMYLNVLQQPEEAYSRLQRALEIDPYYDWTYGLLGSYYARQARILGTEQESQKQELLAKAAEAYRKALQYVTASDRSAQYNYWLELGSVEAQRRQFNAAIEAYQQAGQLASQPSETWAIEEQIARLYYDAGDVANARLHAQSAIDLAPDDQKERLRTLLTQIEG